MSQYVNPIKVITVEGVLKDKHSARKHFARENGNIFNGSWLIGLKSFLYQIHYPEHYMFPADKFIVNVHCNVVNGYEQNVGGSEQYCNPIIAQILIDPVKKDYIGQEQFDSPTFFVVNNPREVLELEFSYTFPVSGVNKFSNFQAVFHYICQTQN